MTELLIRAAGRHPGRLARPAAVAAFAVVLAYGCVLWLTALHGAEGGSERGEPALVVHWLRDATLSLPLVIAAVWVGILLARRLIERCGPACSPRLAAALLAGCVALLCSWALGLANPLHTLLFAAQHGGHEPSFLTHFTRDSLVTTTVALPLAAIVSAALVRARPWTLPDVGDWLAARAAMRRVAFAGVTLAVILPAALVVQAGTDPATAADEARGPCPSGAPLKQFDVTALDVDIPLNRFGDRDPEGKMYALTNRVGDVRAQEASRKVSIGLGDDPIQPLVIRANLGDCVEIAFKNSASGGDYGMKIDGLAHDISSSGDAIGRNPSSAAAGGQSRTYRFWVPREKEAEGGHIVRPGPGNRNAVSHGLFGSLVVEPAGSTYLHPTTRKPIESGWEAIIDPANAASFREFAKLFHEIGNEDYRIPTANGKTLPVVDPNTDAYRPGSRAINYRSEPFFNRLNREEKGDSHAYSSYMFGDPTTPIPRSYRGDPTKIRAMHTGSEVFHIYHLHGGSVRWRANPNADKSFNYADTGLNKHPQTTNSSSTRLDSQAMGPSESFDFQIEGGSGGLQQGAGEFLFHCHIAEHYVAGMWSFWRVFDTRKPDLAPLPDRAAPPDSVDSAGLIGRQMPDGTTITRANLADWVDSQLPPQGVPNNDQDASVWDWRRDESNPEAPVYLGAPESTEAGWPNLRHDEPHPGGMPGDQFVGDRPKILFNPTNGRPAFPLLRPQIGKRPPFSPNGHSGAPYLGENANTPKPASGVNPFARRSDGLCPQNAPVRTFNVVAIDKSIQVAPTINATDQNGKIFVLAKDKEDVLAGRKPPQPLTIRGNQGDCIALTLTSEQADANASDGFAKVNMHVHHVQFDTQASDGVISGLSYEQSVRPFRVEDPTMTAPAAAGATELTLSSAAKFRPGVSIGVGLGTEAIEVRKIVAVNGLTVKLDKPLEKSHAAGDTAGTEFVQYRWYPDVALDNIFWHDHVDGIHNWGHGLVGQFLVEPPGSTYHDPKTGEQVDSGTNVDIRTSNPLAPGQVTGSFRELALFTINGNPATDSTFNLRSEPWSGRPGDPSRRFSSYTYGDPATPLPRAYPGDPFVVRALSTAPGVETLRMDGHRFYRENRFLTPAGDAVASSPTDTQHFGISERFTAILEGGAGGLSQRPGDYLYHNGIGRRFEQGAWGIMRVLPRQVPDLQPLPGRPDLPDGFTLPGQTGGGPPEPAGPGDPCPGGAAQRSFAVSAVDVPDGPDGGRQAYVPTADVAAVRSGQKRPEPLVLHAAAGDCVNVAFSNELASGRASMHVGMLDRTTGSSGMNIGFNPEQTVAPGQTRSYRYFADTDKIGSTTISDFGDPDSWRRGLYGAFVVAPSGARFVNTDSGAATDVGAQLDVQLPGGRSYRDYTVIFADDDPIIGGDFMPYKTDVEGPANINYRSEPRENGANMFSSGAGNGDPATPLLRAYAGDPVTVHAIGAPGSEQPHVFSLGGLSFPSDPALSQSQELQSRGFAAWESVNAQVVGGAGGRARTVGDYFYGDLRRPFTEAGMWGLMRVMSDPSCPIRPLPGLSCNGQPSLITGVPSPLVANPPAAPARPTLPAKPAPRRRVGLRGLVAPRRISLAALTRRGLPIRLSAPATTRALRLRLYRVAGKKARLAAGRVVAVRRGGALRLRWRFSKRAVARMRAGRHLLRVQAGPRKSSIRPATLQRRITLTRPRPSR